ncbi:MAG: hypothetical protein A2X88_03640 [Deltaproteobacteria bacterium GWC2_65_14]|nr:MAG: hypothetical protein A2X88_03640 [Deltaproteobacteria bacterium GWC2_65_14]
MPPFGDVIQYLPGTEKFALPPPGADTLTGAKSVSGRKNRISPDRRANAVFPLSEPRMESSVPLVRRTNCPPWNCSSASDPSGMLTSDPTGTGLLLENSSQSPESGVRTQADPSKIFRRVTE